MLLRRFLQWRRTARPLCIRSAPRPTLSVDLSITSFCAGLAWTGLGLSEITVAELDATATLRPVHRHLFESSRIRLRSRSRSRSRSKTHEFTVWSIFRLSPPAELCRALSSADTAYHTVHATAPRHAPASHQVDKCGHAKLWGSERTTFSIRIRDVATVRQRDIRS